MLKPLRLTVLTPTETLLDVEGVAWVQSHLADGGGIGIYPGHAPLLAETVTAPLRYAGPSGEHTLDLEAGILQVDGDGRKSQKTHISTGWLGCCSLLCGSSSKGCWT